jgi:protoporphyrinogen IX oxidase
VSEAAVPYPWLRALHVAAALAFVGGVLAAALLLPLLAGRAALADEVDAARALRDWQQRVTTPSMLLVWVLGLTLASQVGWFLSGWLRVKLILVLALSGLHGVQSGALRRLAGGAPGRTPAPRMGPGWWSGSPPGARSSPSPSLSDPGACP